MMESEFRDWTRGQLRSLEERLKRLAERKVEPPPPKVGGKLAGGQAAMAQQLLEAIKGGGVTSLAVVYLGPEGPRNGWSSGGLEDHYALMGLVQELANDLLHPDKERLETFREAANDSQPSGHAGADQAPVEG